MASNAQKTPIARTLEQWGQRKARAAIDLLGQSLPCSVASVISSGIVTVKFELTNVPFTLPQITVPIAFPEYVRLPIQQGMKGAVMAFDAYLGGMTGLGGGTADLTPRPNLSNLAFVPLGSTSWAAPIDPNSLELYGPDGVILHNVPRTVTFTLNGTTVTIVGSGSALALVTSAFQALFNEHTHPANNQPPTQQITSAQLTTVLKAQ